jgi:hypothetical protein
VDEGAFEVTILATRTAIVSAVDALAAIGSSVAHGGRFTLDELLRYAVRSPCALTACLGIVGVEREGSVNVAEVQWGVFVVCRGDSQTRRDAEALAAVEAVLNLVPANAWSQDTVQTPEHIRADNLYSSGLDKAGIALWAVTWRQKHDLETVDLETIDSFTKAHLEIDMAEPDDQIDAESTITLEGYEP